MALLKNIKNPYTFVDTTYRVLSEYSYFVDSDQIRVAVNGYANKEVYEQYRLKASIATKTFLFDTKKKFERVEKMKEVKLPAEYSETGSLIHPEMTVWKGTGEFENVRVNEDKYIDLGKLEQSLLSFIETALTRKGDLEGATLDKYIINSPIEIITELPE